MSTLCPSIGVFQVLVIIFSYRKDSQQSNFCGHLVQAAPLQGRTTPRRQN